MTSPDGITWTVRTTDIGYYYSSVTWSPELRLFCAVGYSYEMSIYAPGVTTSPDGIKWTFSTSFDLADWVAAAWSPELKLFCVIANSGVGRGDKVMTSP